MTRRETHGGVSRVVGLLMSVAAATLGVASYLHRDGNIPLGFTTISGERFSGASVPEAVIGFVLAVGAAVVLVTPDRARPAALAANTFAILGVAYGLSITIRDGRAPDLAYHTALMALLLAIQIILLSRAPRATGTMARVRS